MRNDGRPIFITGCARSGTSLTAGIINICGAIPGGQICGATPNNKKGQFENRGLVDSVIKPILKSLNCDPMGQDPLPETDKCEPIPGLRRQIMALLNQQSRNRDLTNRAWFLKGAKFGLIWPIMHAAFPDAQWVITQRPADDIANSCLNTSFMRAFKDKYGWLKWVEAHEKKFDEMESAGLDVNYIDTDGITAGQTESLKILIEEKLGLNWDKSAIDNFIDPGLWHFRSSHGS